GTDYAIQIADAANNLNYTPQFTINSDATAPASSASSSSSAAAPTTKTSSSTVPTTLTTSTVSKVPGPVFTPFGGLNITVGGNGTAPTAKNLPTVVAANVAR